MKAISHRGRITEITPLLTSVEIVSESACSACHASSLCSLSESKTKTVQVPTRGWDSFTPGDEVEVILKASMGHKAVWIAYVVPLFVLLALILALTALGFGELASGLLAMAGVAVYYFLIWLFRKKLQDQYEFEIREIRID